MPEKELVKGFEEIRNLFTEILVISQEQLKIAGELEHNPDLKEKMAELFKKRQSKMKRIDNCLGEHSKYKYTRTRDKEEKESSGTGEAQDSSLKRDELIRIITDIQNTDQQSRTIVEKNRQQISKKLNAVRTSKKTYNAYMQNDSCLEGWFFDRKK